MRFFISARHAESALNAAGLLSSDPSRPIGLTPQGTEQARRLGQQLANLNIDLAVATRFLRTRETVELALHGRDIPLLVEPDLDEIRAGGFDGKPISAYWAWKDEHGRGERFPHGESLDDAVRRYADALRRLLGRSEAVTLIVGHELAIRYIVEAAAGANTLGLSEIRIANATPYLFNETALRSAAERLDALASPAPRTETRTEVRRSGLEVAAVLVSRRPERRGDTPDAERQFAQRMGANTVEIPLSHVAMVHAPRRGRRVDQERSSMKLTQMARRSKVDDRHAKTRAGPPITKFQQRIDMGERAWSAAKPSQPKGDLP